MSEQQSKTSEPQVDEVRRAALIRMGRYAAYTAPAMTSLLIADRAAAATSVRGGHHSFGHWVRERARPRRGGRPNFGQWVRRIVRSGRGTR